MIPLVDRLKRYIGKTIYVERPRQRDLDLCLHIPIYVTSVEPCLNARGVVINRCLMLPYIVARETLERMEAMK